MKFKITLTLMLLPLILQAQSTFAPLNEDYYHSIDRYEVKAGKIFSEIFTAVKQYKRQAIVAFIDSVHHANLINSKADQFNHNYLRNDNWEWSNAETNNSASPVLKKLYRKKSDLYHAEVPDFDLHVNPVLYLSAGKDSRRNEMLYINTRGVEVRGMIDKKVGFYTYLTDNQAVLPSYVYDQMTLNPVIPHEGFWKDFKKGKGVDFLQARAYITVEATKHISIQFGNDRTFVGNGYRSLILSDYAPPSLFLKANAQVWKINYLFMINRVTAHAEGSINGTTATATAFPEKYIAFHHLSMNIGKKLNLGLFESVVFSQKDSANATRGFDLGYLNPIIFYRAIEQQNGSSDNVILGLDFKWNAIKKVSLYGQVVLDEFVLKHIKASDGWWANKFAIQAGLKYIDALGISNFDLQGEVNIARPYTYSHYTDFGSYSSYNQPMAHPLGANFTELVGIMKYQPLPKLNLTAKLILTTIGRDTTGVNWGSDILKNNSSRQQELQNKIGQGIANNIIFGSFTATWMVKHNLFVDANIILRQSTSAISFYNNNTSISSLALRWNIAKRLYEF